MAWSPSPVARVNPGQRLSSAAFGNAMVAQVQGVFNVCNPTFGATGDNSTDDSAAFIAADTAATAAGGCVYVPPGTFIAGGISPTAPWIGASRDLTTIKAPANADPSLAFGYSQFTVATKSNLSFRNIKFDANLANQTTGYFGTLCTLYGLTISGACSNIKVIDCDFKDFFAYTHVPADGHVRTRCTLENLYGSGGWGGFEATSFQAGSRLASLHTENTVMRGVNAYNMADSELFDFHCKTVSYAGTKAVWSALAVKAKGAITYATSSPAGIWWRCTTAGTTGAMEPVWSGSTVTDGSVVWAKVEMTDAIGIDFNSVTRCQIDRMFTEFTFSHAWKFYNGASENTLGMFTARQPGYTSASSGNDGINGNHSATGHTVWVGSGACLNNKGGTFKIYQPAGYGGTILSTCTGHSIDAFYVYDSHDPGLTVQADDFTCGIVEGDGCDGPVLSVGSDDDGADIQPTNFNFGVVKGKNGAQSVVKINGAAKGSFASVVGNNMGDSCVKIQRHPVYTSRTPHHIAFASIASFDCDGYPLEETNGDYISVAAMVADGNSDGDSPSWTGANNTGPVA